MMLAVQPVRLTAAPRRCSSAAPRCVATCSLRERAGAALAATTLALTLSVAPPAFAKAADFGVYWLSPDDGATLSSPVAAKFGVKGLDVKPAGARRRGGAGRAAPRATAAVSAPERLRPPALLTRPRAAEGVQEGTGHHHVIVDGDFMKACPASLLCRLQTYSRFFYRLLSTGWR